MKINPSVWEDEYLDDEDVSFEKLTRKAKTVKQDRISAIQQKRKEKMRRQEASEQEELSILIDDSDQERFKC